MKRLAALVFMLAFSAATAAQGWPAKPVRVVVPAPAGSSLDIIVRMLGDKLKDRWGQPVVVDNKAGAGGMLGLIGIGCAREFAASRDRYHSAIVQRAHCVKLRRVMLRQPVKGQRVNP